ncbi:MAG: O-antigen polymerase [Paludibacteraceae bacterium]
MLCYSYYRARSVLHPAVVTSALWLVMLVLYATIDHGLYPLSDKFHIALLCWGLPLCIASLAVQHIRIGIPIVARGEANLTTIAILKPIVAICVMISTAAILYRGHVYDPDNLFHGIRTASVISLQGGKHTVSFPIWASLALEITNMLLLPICLYLLFIEEKRNWLSIGLTIVLVIYTVIRSNKTVIAQVGLAFLCIMWYKKRINKRNFLLILLALFALFMLAHLLRRTSDSSEFVFLDFITMYLFAPLPAFDHVLNLHHSLIEQFHGEYTFRAFIRFAHWFDPTITGNADPFNLNYWVYTPVHVNVYTTMFPFYADFGYAGIAIFGALYGATGGIIYKHMTEGNGASLLIYSCLFYILVFQFFADFGMTYFWSIVGLVIGCTLLFTKVRI